MASNEKNQPGQSLSTEERYSFKAGKANTKSKSSQPDVSETLDNIKAINAVAPAAKSDTTIVTEINAEKGLTLMIPARK